MTTDAAIAERIQLADPGRLITLYVLDASSLGGSVYRFTSSVEVLSVLEGYSQSIVFDGNTYTPIEFESEGWEWNGRGSLPTPRIRISNANQVLAAATITLNDLVGATLTRIRTFERFLDTGMEPDPTAVFPLDVYRVDRKVNFNKVFIEWELAAVMDQQGRQLPGRQFLKDVCTHIYRKFDGDMTDFFDYTNASCPYAGTDYFDIQGNRVDNAEQDVCGKRLSNCRQRFGENGILPTRQFPGMRRF